MPEPFFFPSGLVGSGDLVSRCRGGSRNGRSSVHRTRGTSSRRTGRDSGGCVGCVWYGTGVVLLG